MDGLSLGILAQLGVGGLVIVLSLREMFRFLGERKPSGNGNGTKYSAEFWQLEIRKAVDDTITKGVNPSLQAHTELLTDIRDGIVKLVDRDSRRQ